MTCQTIAACALIGLSAAWLDLPIRADEPQQNAVDQPGGDESAGDGGLLAVSPPIAEAAGEPVWSLDFSQDGSMLAAAAGKRNGRGTILVWNTKGWSQVLRLTEERAATCVAFSPDGGRLAVGTQKGEVLVLDVAAKKVTGRWPSGHWAVFGIAWTPDGRDVIAACANGYIRVFRARSGELVQTLDTWQADDTANSKRGGHADRNIWDLAVTRDGKTLLSGGWNDTTRLWDLQTGELLRDFFRSDSSTQGVQFTADERHFLSAGIGTGHVAVRETSTRRQRATLATSGRDVAMHPDGRLIAAASLEGVEVYRLNLTLPGEKERVRYRRLVEQLGAREYRTRRAAYAELRSAGLAAESVLAEAAEATSPEVRRRAARLHDQARSPAPFAVLGGHRGEVRQAAFSPAGDFLASSTTDGDVRVWDTKEFKLRQAFTVTAGD